MWIRLPGLYGLLSLVGITEPSGVCLPAKELGQHLSQRKNLILVGREDSEEEPDGGSYWSPEFCAPEFVPDAAGVAGVTHGGFLVSTLGS